MEVENQKNVTAQTEISEPAPKPEPEAQPAPAEEIENPLLSAAFSLDEVKSGMGNNVLGQYGYITAEDITAFRHGECQLHRRLF